ncbi:MAG: OmpA family protein [Bacteroidota bacterium]
MGRVKIVGLILIILCGINVSVAQKQSNYQKANSKKYKKKYKKLINSNLQCFRLFKKKYKSKNKKVTIRGKKQDNLPLAEFDPDDVSSSNSKPQLEGQPQILTVEEKKDFREKTSEDPKTKDEQVNENEVLNESSLPTTSSKKHEEIRKLVESKLKEHKDGDPIKLEPLYFKLDNSEFAFVDMEPFLVAVEYALQGRVVLIEGHADDPEQDYNVKLSIQRVEKVRQLMQDMGVPDERISVVGYGEDAAKNNNQEDGERSKNRRVDFTAY